MSEPPNYDSSPFAKQVHNESRINATVGLSHDSQRGLRFKLIESILQIVTQAITGIFLPGPVGSAFNQLTHFFSATLPSLITAPLSALVDLLVDILDSIPFIGPSLGNAVEDLARLLGLMHTRTGTAQGTGDNAQFSADNANVAIAVLAAGAAAGGVVGGQQYNNTFSYTNSLSLGSDFDQTYSGSASGTLHTQKNNAILVPGGSGGVRIALARISAMTCVGDTQGVSIVQNDTMGAYVTPPELRLMLRMNSAKTEYVMARVIGDGTVEIGKVIAGTYTRIGSPVTVANVAGDRWTFKAGTTVSAYELLLYRNSEDSPTLQVTDTVSTLHTIGSSNRFAAFGITSGQTVIPLPPGGAVVKVKTAIVSAVQAISAYDRLAAA